MTRALPGIWSARPGRRQINAQQPRRKKGNPVHGWIILDKPLGLTSTQAVARVKRLCVAQKAGHGGTLDPLASGLLPIALGEATKVVAYAMDGAKTYRFTIRWGAETDTDDAEGATVETASSRPQRDQIEAALASFRGDISQVPPRYSAIKVDGARAYDMAREGLDVVLEPRLVSISDLRLVAVPDEDHAEFETDCGKGTYVRALARDIGRHLGCFGHVVALRRTRVGPWQECDMITLDKLQGLSHSGAAQEAPNEFLRPVATALDDIPALAVSSADAVRMKRGQPVMLRGRDAPVLQGTVFVESRGVPVALAEVRQGAIHPKRVFNMSS
jgi:tRNA pseudouridine55 synthase